MGTGHTLTHFATTVVTVDIAATYQRDRYSRISSFQYGQS